MRRMSMTYLLIFGIYTILTIFIVYKDVNHPFATVMVGGYVIFLIASLCYFLSAILWKARKLPRPELQRRTRRFILYFVIFFGLSFLINLSDPNYYKSISIAFGMSLGLSFFDLVLLPKKN
jgi:O-antigen/teichoic acid export membrane protein